MREDFQSILTNEDVHVCPIDIVGVIVHSEAIPECGQAIAMAKKGAEHWGSGCLSEKKFLCNQLRLDHIGYQYESAM